MCTRSVVSDNKNRLTNNVVYAYVKGAGAATGRAAAGQSGGDGAEEARFVFASSVFPSAGCTARSTLSSN